MSYDNASIAWSANQLSKMVKGGTITFQNVVQRSYVWERARKSLFIHSLAIGLPIPPTYAKRMEEVDENNKTKRIYDMLDGKQRLSTIAQFLNDEFALSDIPTVEFTNLETNETQEYDMSGKKFSELPDDLKDKISNARINVSYFDNLDSDEERELFKRLNNGKPLATKSKTLASCKDISGFLNIGSHDVFSDMLTDKSRENKNQVSIVMKVWCMMNQEIKNVSFESKVFNPLLENTTISEAEKVSMIEVFDTLMNVHTALVDDNKKIARKLYTETHFVSLVPFFKKAIENGIEDEMLEDWVTSFFDSADGASVSDEYNAACGSGSAKNVNIVARNTALENSFNKFFQSDDAETNLEDNED